MEIETDSIQGCVQNDPRCQKSIGEGNVMLKTVCALSLLVIVGMSNAPKPRETDVAAMLAQRYQFPPDRVEYRLPDGRRIDIYDDVNGITWEVEWCKKWEESIGQAIGYAAVMDAEPGVWLLFESGDDEEWNQFQTAAEYLQSRGIPLHVRTHRL